MVNCNVYTNVNFCEVRRLKQNNTNRAFTLEILTVALWVYAPLIKERSDLTGCCVLPRSAVTVLVLSFTRAPLP